MTFYKSVMALCLAVVSFLGGSACYAAEAHRIVSTCGSTSSADIHSSALSTPRGGGVFRNKHKGVDLTKATVPKGKYSIGRALEFHKISWLPVALYMMKIHNNTSVRAALMAGLFGGYGILWVIKSYAFWDKTFYIEPETGIVNLGTFLFANTSLLLYLLFPYVATTNTAVLSSRDIIVSTVLYSIGVLYHYAADSQKFFCLKNRKALVTDGLFRNCRNPSYFGEWLIWIAFTIIAGIDQKLLLLPNIWFALVTISQAILKDKSLSKYRNFEEWKRQTWLLFPKLF